MDTTQTTHISLCAGYGGIDLGLKRAIPNLRTVAFSEIEGFACANLVAKMEAGLLDSAPVWTDLKTFPWQEFSGRVDILSGGYPCQPFSAAGKRLGTDDPRHLWPFIASGIRILRPRLCFFENVEGHISLGLREVVGELESMGYQVSWGIFSASEVGAPHQRKRVFIMAVASGFRGAAGISGSFQRHERHSGESNDCGDKGMANAECSGLVAGRDNTRRSKVSQSQHCSAWPSRPGEPQHGWEPPRVVGNAERTDRTRGKQDAGARLADGREAVGNTSSQRCEQDPSLRGEQQASGSSEECGAGVGKTMADNLRGRLPHTTNEQRIEWTDDYAVIRTRASESGGRQTQPPLGGDPDGSAGGMDYAELSVSCDNRTDELRLLGNGVVPASAERAFRTLIARFDKVI